jgi:cell division protein FtsN
LGGRVFEPSLGIMVGIVAGLIILMIIVVYTSSPDYSSPRDHADYVLWS